jgi:hypothetical protein
MRRGQLIAGQTHALGHLEKASERPILAVRAMRWLTPFHSRLVRKQAA